MEKTVSEANPNSVADAAWMLIMQICALRDLMDALWRNAKDAHDAASNPDDPAITVPQVDYALAAWKSACTLLHLTTEAERLAKMAYLEALNAPAPDAACQADCPK